MDNPAKSETSITYRSDVDGMRAVAVLLVVFSHLQIPYFPGGYVGVDVFFVISGYLISSVILSEMKAGRFSIANFYERRIRRIIPALLAMMLATSAMAYRYFMPADLKTYGWSAIAALFSISNFFFWRKTGYFDGLAAMKPLLHTWSLAVEEQFYIFFPIFLLVVRKLFPKRLGAAIWTLTIVTLAAACFWVWRDIPSAFYLAPLRAWELLIGTIVSQKYLPPIRGRLARNAASLAGISLILYAAVHLTSQSVFPGFNALVPCLGAALIIAAGERGTSVVGRILGWGPVVFVGLISYSLYLWHWPILVLNAQIHEEAASTPLAKLEILAVSIAVATLSWLLVETPFRKGRFRPRRKALFAITGGAAAGLAAIGAVMVVSNGLPSRFSPAILKMSNYASYYPRADWRLGECFLAPSDRFASFRRDVCLRSDPGRKTYLLIGDSLAAGLYPGLRKVYPDVNVQQATVQSCPLVVNEPPERVAIHPNCAEMSALLFSDYLVHQKVDTVLIAGNWHDPDLPELAHTLDWIRQRGMNVVLFGPSIEYDMPMPLVLAAAMRDHNGASIQRHWRVARRELDGRMRILARDQWKVPYISVFDDLCSDQFPKIASGDDPQFGPVSGCPLYAAPDVPLLFDIHHLTPQGSVILAQIIRSKGELL